jgi:hypothetical protein
MRFQRRNFIEMLEGAGAAALAPRIAAADEQVARSTRAMPVSSDQGCRAAS